MNTTLDGFSRVTSRATTNGNHTLTTTFTYAAGANGGTTSARVTGIQQLDSAHALTYTYTDAGLIASVTIGTDTVAYTYDSIGQLIRVDDPTDTTAGSTVDWYGKVIVGWIRYNRLRKLPKWEDILQLFSGSRIVFRHASTNYSFL